MRMLSCSKFTVQMPAQQFQVRRRGLGSEVCDAPLPKENIKEMKKRKREREAKQKQIEKQTEEESSEIETKYDRAYKQIKK